VPVLVPVPSGDADSLALTRRQNGNKSVTATLRLTWLLPLLPGCYAGEPDASYGRLRSTGTILTKLEGI
jgi:hypothetical protein